MNSESEHLSGSDANHADGGNAHAGERYEREAEVLLLRNGLKLVARNWRCRHGEIDLIMREGETLVFIEVRKRNSQRFGGAVASIGRQKRERLNAAIALYLSSVGVNAFVRCRVDAVLFDAMKAPEWIKNIMDGST